MSKEDKDLFKLKEDEHEMFKNILAFVCLVREKDELLKMPPEYIKEKYLRYIKHPIKNEYQWGLWPGLRNGIFLNYCKHFDIPCPSLEEEEAAMGKYDL